MKDLHRPMENINLAILPWRGFHVSHKAQSNLCTYVIIAVKAKHHNMEVICREKVPIFLKGLNLGYSDLQIHSTPRRLIISAQDLAGRQPDSEERIRGPPAKVLTDDA